jgi:mono/diheme cytochrome c family protein
MLAAAVSRSGEVSAVEQILDRVADLSSPAWQRTALFQGLNAGLSVPGGGRGRGVGATAPVRALSLPREPAGLTRIAASEDAVAAVARRVLARLDWPGKPAVVAAPATPLTAEEQKRFDAGAELYKGICSGCHQADGGGREKIAANLVDSRFVTAPDAGAAARILLGGKEGAIGLMPPLGGALSNEQIASVLTYIRREWGHAASAVAPEEIQEVRGLTKARSRPWTDAELQTVGRRGRAAGRGGS